MTDTSGNRSAATLVVLYSAGSEDVFNADRGLCAAAILIAVIVALLVRRSRKRV